MLNILFVFLLASIVIGEPKPGGGVFQLKTRRIPTNKATLLLETRMEKFIAQKNPNTTDQTQGKVFEQPLVDILDRCYMADITLGTPAQTLTVIMDTGSSDMWLIDAKCEEENCKGKYGHSKKQFDPLASTSFKRTNESFEITYLKGSPEGYIGYDVLELAGMKVLSQGVGVATRVSPEFGQVQLDGILGLGWPALSDNEVTPPMQNILNQLDRPIFTVFMSRHENLDGNAVNGGLITFGGFDRENCHDEINYVSLTSKSYWQFKMDGFRMGECKTGGSYQAMTDTGTSYIGCPFNVFAELVNRTRAELIGYNALN